MLETILTFMLATLVNTRLNLHVPPPTLLSPHFPTTKMVGFAIRGQITYRRVGRECNIHTLH